MICMMRLDYWLFNFRKRKDEIVNQFWYVKNKIPSAQKSRPLSPKNLFLQSLVMMSPQWHSFRIKQSLLPPPMQLLIPNTPLFPPLVNRPPTQMIPFLLQASPVISEPGFTLPLQRLFPRLFLLPPLATCFALSGCHGLA